MMGGYFNLCKKEISNTLDRLKGKAKEILNIEKKEITEEDIETFHKLQVVYAYLDAFSSFFYKEPISDLKKGYMLSTVNTYCEALREKLKKYKQLHEVEFKVNVGERLSKLLGWVESSERPKKYYNLPATRLIKEDRVISDRKKGVLDFYEAKEDEFSDKYDKYVEELAELEKACGVESIDSLNRIMTNLKLVEKKFGLDSSDELNDYFESLFSSIEFNFNSALDLKDFETANFLLKKIAALPEMSEEVVERFNDKLVTSVENLIPKEKNFTNDEGVLELTEETTKQFIYVMHIAMLLKNNTILRKIHNKLEGVKEVYINQLDDITKKNKDNVEGMKRVSAPLQQFAYALSVYERTNKSLIDAFESRRESIKTFVIGFRQRYVERLKVTAAMLSDVEVSYTEMANYLDSLRTCYWVKHFELPDQTESVLLAGLKKRFEELTNCITTADLTLVGHENIKNIAWMYHELSIAYECLNRVITDEIRGILERGLASFRDRVGERLTHIANICGQEEFEKLSFEEMVQFSQYVDACYKGEVLSQKTSQAQVALIGAIQRFTNGKVIKLRGLLSEFAAWQGAENNIYPDIEKEVAPAVEDIKNIFELLFNLKNNKQLSGYYNECDDPIKNCEQFLQTNLQSFTKELDKAIQELLATNPSEELNDNDAKRKVEFGKKVGKMLGICEKLKVVDKFLPADARDTFEKLHERMDKAASNEFRAVLKAIVDDVRAGKFDDAIKKSNDLAVELQIKMTLCTQVSSIVRNLAEGVKESLKLLSASESTSPDFLNKLMAQVVLLKEATRLQEVEMVDKKVNTERGEVLREVQTAANQWLANCVRVIESKVKAFEILEVINATTRLQETIQDMPVKPQDADVAIGKLRGQIDKRVEQAVTIFTTAVGNWKKEDYSLTEICRQLQNAQKKMDGSDKRYSTAWSKISEAAFKGVQGTCKSMIDDIAANRKSTEDVIAVVKSIEGQVVSMPDDETTQLKSNVLAECKTVMQRLIDKVAGDETVNFDARLNKICQMMAANNDRTTIFRELELGKILAPLHHEVRELKEKIKKQCSLLEFPQEELIKFLHIESRASSFSEEVKQSAGEVGASMRQFSEKVVKSLSEELATYQSSKHSECLPTILAACEKIRSISEFKKNLSLEERSYFVKMLPGKFSNDIRASFERLLEILNANKETFNAAWEKRQVEGLKDALDFTEAWRSIVREADLYIRAAEDKSAPSIDNTFADISEHHTHYNLAARVNQVREIINDMLGRADTNVVDYLRLAETSEKARKEHFANLVKAYGFISKCEQIKDYLGDEDYKNKFKQSVTKYLQELFSGALSELPKELDPGANWENFGKLYKEISAFVENFKSNEEFSLIILNTNEGEGSCEARNAATFVKGRFDSLLAEKNVAMGKAVKESKAEMKDVVNYILSLQQIIDMLPVPQITNSVKLMLTEFLAQLHHRHGDGYLDLVSKELQSNESGLGAAVIKGQSCFAGLSISMRNTRAIVKTIEEVLPVFKKRAGNGEIIPLSEVEKNDLTNAFKIYEEKYNELLKKHLKEKVDFDGIVDELKLVADKDAIKRDKDDKIIWDQSVADKIPTMMAYLFAIWTLRDAKAYLNQPEGDDRKSFLKTPNPTQVVAILRMLNAVGDVKDLPSHLAQVLTGEGKSIVLAVAAEVLALVGYSVNCACYSEHLSERDYNDFKEMFELLGVDKYIQYGTFNKFIEDTINKKADLRQLVETAIRVGNTEVREEDKEKRETVMLIDEVDVFFSSEFSGGFYNPVLNLRDDNIKILINKIWMLHQLGDSAGLRDINKSIEYNSCVEKYLQWKFLFDKAIDEMIAALKTYQIKDGHQYVVNEGKIAYKYQDGLSDDISMGYQTMWAYFHEAIVVRAISEEELAKNMSVRVNCGHFSYKEMLKEIGFKSILGVTGTLAQLNQEELNVLTEEFGIDNQTFVPSVYGESRLKFNPKEDIQIVPRKDFHRELANLVQILQRGKNDASKAIRPVMVFFDEKLTPDNKTLLKSFHESRELQEIASNIGFMTKKSSSNKAEREQEVTNATKRGRVTLAEREMGRGNDTFCADVVVNTNGGTVGIGTFWPDLLSEEIQIRGRIARQGMEGAFRFILCEEDLMEQFNLSAPAMSEIKSSGNIYDQLDKLRQKKFAVQYEKESKKISAAKEVLHVPSKQLLDCLHKKDVSKEDIVKHLKVLNLPLKTVEQKEKRTLIAIDATGSMSSVIDSVKSVISGVLESLAVVLAKNGFDPKLFPLQLAIYRNYNSLGDQLFKCSEWSTDQKVLQKFVDEIFANEGGVVGGYEEAVEVALCHAWGEVGRGAPLSQVIVIGDIGANTPRNLASYKQSYNDRHSEKWYWPPEEASDWTKRLEEKKIPVKGLCTRSTSINAFALFCTKKDEKGEEKDVAFMDVSNPDKAKASIVGMFGRATFAAAAGGNEELQNKMFGEYTKFCFNGNR